LLPGLAPSGLSAVVDLGTKHVEHLERAIDVPQAFPIPLRSMADPPSSPHDARELQHFLDACGCDAWLWGQSVELLWRVTMTVMDKNSMLSAWTALTPRLLLWRSLVGEERSAVGEWARRETVRLVNE
jgi:nucleolar pre-ribosomal-associated protein 1